MTTRTVREDAAGGYTTLAAAIAAADPSDVIDIQQWSTSYEVGTLTIADAGLTISASGSARVDPTNLGAGNHYKIKAASSGDTNHVFTINGAGAVIDGLEILQNSSGTSDEGIRATVDFTVKNSVIWANTNVAQQDGIYVGNDDVDVTVEDTIIFGFPRGGIHGQNYSGTVTQNWYLNSVEITDCGSDGGTNDSGGVLSRSDQTDTRINMYVANSIVASQDAAAAGSLVSFEDRPDQLNWYVERTFYGTAHQVSFDTDTNNTSGAQITENTSPGAGTWVIVPNFTTRPYDLTLVDDADNDAVEAHSVTSFLGGALTLPTTDIVGTTRTAAYCIGPFEAGESAPEPSGETAGVILNL